MPLRDITVVDFSTLLPGCYASMVLGDLGATVYKIERKGQADLLKQLPPLADGVSTWYQVLNRNKKIIKLDLKDKHDYEQALALVRQADVLLEGFRPQVMKRLALDYETLRNSKHDLIYCSISGYGQKGAMSTRAGHDINFLARSSINSFCEHAPPTLSGIQTADVCGGAMYAVVGIFTALWHRQRSGEGQYLDVALFDTTMSLASAPLSKYLGAGIMLQHGDDLLNGGTIYGYYQTKDKRYISVGAIEEKFRQTLADTLQIPYLSMQDRSTLAKKFKEKTLEEWHKIFSDKDCCVEPNLSCAETLSSQHCAERHLVVEVANKQGKKQKQIAHPIHYSTIKPRYDFIGGADD